MKNRMLMRADLHQELSDFAEEDISHSKDIVQALIDGRIRHVRVVF